jgi:hypothetical protein
MRAVESSNANDVVEMSGRVFIVASGPRYDEV